MTLNHEPKLDREPTTFALDEFNAVIRYLKTRGEERFAQYLVDQCAFSNYFAIVLEGDFHARENIGKHGRA